MNTGRAYRRRELCHSEGSSGTYTCGQRRQSVEDYHSRATSPSPPGSRRSGQTAWQPVTHAIVYGRSAGPIAALRSSGTGRRRTMGISCAIRAISPTMCICGRPEPRQHRLEFRAMVVVQPDARLDDRFHARPSADRKRDVTMGCGCGAGERAGYPSSVRSMGPRGADLGERRAAGEPTLMSSFAKADRPPIRGSADTPTTGVSDFDAGAAAGATRSRFLPSAAIPARPVQIRRLAQ